MSTTKDQRKKNLATEKTNNTKDDIGLRAEKKKLFEVLRLKRPWGFDWKQSTIRPV